MRIAAFGLTVLTVLVIGFSGLSWHSASAELPQQPQANARPATALGHAMAAAGNLMAFSSNAGNGINQVTLIDAETRVMSVYHIDGTSGQIKLMGVRNVRWDLLMEDFNGVQPLPREIRDILEHR